MHRFISQDRILEEGVCSVVAAEGTPGNDAAAGVTCSSGASLDAMQRDCIAPGARTASHPRQLPVRTAHLPALQMRPGNARDRHAMQAYAAAHDLNGLMHEFTHSLILNRPADPVAFLHGVLGERMASNGGNSATENRPIMEHRLAQGTTDAAMLRVQVEYSGHEGMRCRNFSTLVASASPMARSGAQAQATGAIRSLLWAADSSPSAQEKTVAQQPSVNAAVLAVEESLLAFWMMRGGGEEGDTSIAAFFRTASGLTWAPIGTARPTLGRELVNKELRDALAQKLEIDASEDGTNEKALQFTRGEWDRLGVRLDPGVNFFVKVGDFFFKPAENEGVPATLNAEELGTVVRETLGCDLDPAHDTSLLERLTRAPRYETPLLLTLLLSLQTRVSL